MIENVLANPDKETTKLIRAAQEDYESEYFCFYTWVHDVCECYLDMYLSMFFPSISWLNVFSCPSELPANEKFHDLVSLLNFDSTKVSGEMLGEESVWHVTSESSRNIGDQETWQCSLEMMCNTCCSG